MKKSKFTGEQITFALRGPWPFELQSVLSVGQRFARRCSLLLSLRKRHSGVAAERKRLLLTEKPIVHSPQATASWRNQEIPP